MKKSALAISVGIILIAILVLFSKSTDQPTKPITDNNAPSQTQKIISLSPNITEILFALGLGDEIAGVTTYCNYPPEAKQKHQVGSITVSDTETILSLRPTIVLTTASTLHTQFCKRLEQLGIKAAPVKVEMLSDLFAGIKTIGKNCQKTQEAIALSEQLETQLINIKNSTQKSPKPSVLIVIQREPLIVCGENTFINELLEIAGGKNAIGKTMAPYPLINSESLLTCDPDIIIETSNKSNDQLLQDAKQFYSKWPNLKAVKNGNIALANADVLSRPGPRVVQAAEMLANILHPDRAKDDTIDVTESSDLKS